MYKMENIQEKIVKEFAQKTDLKIKEFFEPYFRDVGIKGDITLGKTKWRGLRMHIEENIGNTTYQLFQRGVAISPVLVIEYNYLKL